MSAPLVVNTTDGTCWTRRASTRGGLALYAMAEVPSCPDVVMATYEELVEHGIAGEADALPMPVAPASQVGPIAHAAKNTDLLLADATERRRAVEWPWDMWCRICLVRLTSHRTEADALEAADRHVSLQHAPQAEVHQLMAAGGLAELERLRARVAELEAAPLAWTSQLDAKSLDNFLITLGAATEHEPMSGAVDAIHELIRGFRAEVSADRLTALFAPTQALREGETGGAS